jgi:hypothetical protein
MGLVRKNTNPKSVINEIITILRPNIENISKNVRVLIINDARNNANIARKIVEKIKLALQTHLPFLKVP